MTLEVPLSETGINCVFCRIDADLVAFDAVPGATPLHVLVVPRRHIRSVAELADIELAGRLVLAASRITHRPGDPVDVVLCGAVIPPAAFVDEWTVGRLGPGDGAGVCDPCRQLAMPQRTSRSADAAILMTDFGAVRPWRASVATPAIPRCRPG